MSILALGSTQWIKRSYTSTPTNMSAWHRQEKNLFLRFQILRIFVSPWTSVWKSRPMFPSGFSVEEPQNNFSHITIQLLLNYCQEHLFVPSPLSVYMYVRLQCKKKIEPFFIFFLFLFSFNYEIKLKFS